jgi:transposase
MTMVGGFDVHRQQITFDHVDSDGLVRWGQIRPATRDTLRHWLGEHCPDGDAEFALEGCTGWRYVTEELAAAGVDVHLGDPAEIAALRGPKKRAKTDRADARLLRTLVVEGRFPESWIPPAHVVEIRTLGRLYCTLMDERRAWQQRVHAQLFHQGCPPIRALLSEAGRAALARVEVSAAGRQYVDTALRRIDELTAEIDPLRAQLVGFARRQRGCQALQRHYTVGPRITPTTTSWRPNTTATTARTPPWPSSAKSCAAAITRCANSAMPRCRTPQPRRWPVSLGNRPARGAGSV